MDSQGNIYSDEQKAVLEKIFGNEDVRPRAEVPPDAISIPADVGALNRAGRRAYHSAIKGGATHDQAMGEGVEAMQR